jgi:iron(III) transport system permease protein
MIAVKTASGLFAEGWSARFHPRLRHLALGGIAVAAALLALAPLASLVVIAFGDSGDIWAHLIRHVVPVALLQTALLLAGVTVVATVLGVGTAWLVTTFEFPGRGTFAWLLPLPLAIPPYIAAYIYVDLLDALGPVQSLVRAVFGETSVAWLPGIRSLWGAVWIFGVVLYPYVFLSARAMFQTECRVFADAARGLGAPPWRLARTITLPLARPAIAVGLALALLETLNDIGATEYLGVQTLTLSIFTTWLNRGSLAGAAQISCVMLLLVLALFALERYGRRRRSFASLVQDPRPAPRVALTPARQWCAAGACLVPIAFGFLFPAGFLLREVIARGLIVGFDPALARHTFTTVAFAACATVLVVALGFAAVAAVRWLRSPFVAACASLGSLGYAIPGTVLALGLLTPLVAVDEGINWLTRSIAGVSVGLVVIGSGAAVVIAYVTRFLAIALGFAQAGFARLSPDFDDAARILGAGPGHVARTVHLPLTRPAMWGAALLVFVDCMKELPATLLLRPLNTETLATYIYQFATRGSFEQGALAALIIVAVGVVPVIAMVRYAELTPTPERDNGAELDDAETQLASSGKSL